MHAFLYNLHYSETLILSNQLGKKLLIVVYFHVQHNIQKSNAHFHFPLTKDSLVITSLHSITHISLSYFYCFTILFLDLNIYNDIFYC